MIQTYHLRRMPVLWTATLAALLAAAASHAAIPPTDAVADIGSRRELFVDTFLVDQLKGQAQLCLHHPVPQEEVFVFDAPWEGSGSNYVNIFKDGDIYRMYYKGVQIDPFKEFDEKIDKEYLRAIPLCYAESDDGIHWRRPELGLHEFRGSKANNIVVLYGDMDGMNVDPGAAAVFKDDNPAAPPDARYKAVIHSEKPKKGLLILKSADGINWSLLSRQVVITDGAFDSQNLAFWDPVHETYRAYWRYFTRGRPPATPGGNTSSLYVGVRAIRTATSKDLLHWEGQKDLSYADSPEEHLYTNQIKPYHRAPHLLIGVPTRYVEPELPKGVMDDARAPAGPEKTKKWSASMHALPELEHRLMRASASERYGSALTDTVLMTSRDGVNFRRWNEAFIRPGIEREGTWNYGHLFTAWHIVETKSNLPGAPNELSLYSGENYWTGNSATLRRYTLRLDGFVSAQAPLKGGELITKPVRFAGRQLVINFATSAAGRLRVEIQDINGNPLPGFSLAECSPMFGDTVERGVEWVGGQDVSRLAGLPVRLRFELKDADLYAFQFKE